MYEISARVSSTEPQVVLRTVGPQRRPGLVAPPVQGAAAVESVKIVVCHPAVLAGQAIAAALRPARCVAGVLVASSATALLRELPQSCDVALVSEDLGNDLPELLQALVYRGVALPVVVMTTDSSPDTAAQYLEWGAAGSVDVRGPLPTISQAALLAASGRPVVDPRVTAQIASCLEDRAVARERAAHALAALSRRERQVIESLASGTGVTEIAGALHLSPHTIRACIRTLGPKLGVAGQLQIASVARGLLHLAQQPVSSRYLQRVRAAGLGTMRLSS